MSAATASSTDRVRVYVRLLDEAVDVWRPVYAERIGQSIARLCEQAVPDEEVWSFGPGDTVVVEMREGSSGEPERLVAVARAQDIDEPSRAVRAVAG